MRVSAVVLRSMVIGNQDTGTVQLREHFVGDISRGASLLSKCLIAAAKNAPNTCGLGLWRKSRGAVKGKLIIMGGGCAELIPGYRTTTEMMSFSFPESSSL
jgi:hypothetical protein